jgi:ribosomal protein S18 acetylase RimI-like enzyme
MNGTANIGMLGLPQSGTSREGRKLGTIMKLRSVSRDQFIAAISDSKEDKFAKTFRAKADMQEQWLHCQGCFDIDGNLMGAIIVTKSKRLPTVYNLQLLHTFGAFRKSGVGRFLVESVLSAISNEKDAYFRVSSEPDAVGFYEALGFRFLGKQKSGCQLSMFKIVDGNPANGIYSLNESAIFKAVHKHGKGGCVEVF